MTHVDCLVCYRISAYCWGLWLGIVERNSKDCPQSTPLCIPHSLGGLNLMTPFWGAEFYLRKDHLGPMLLSLSIHLPHAWDIASSWWERRGISVSLRHVLGWKGWKGCHITWRANKKGHFPLPLPSAHLHPWAHTTLSHSYWESCTCVFLYFSGSWVERHRENRDKLFLILLWLSHKSLVSMLWEKILRCCRSPHRAVVNQISPKATWRSLENDHPPANLWDDNSLRRLLGGSIGGSLK